MIVVQADLNPGGISAPAHHTNLCRIEIVNDGAGGGARGNYDVRLYARDNGRLIRTARVENYARNAKPAWRLIQAAMKALGE